MPSRLSPLAMAGLLYRRGMRRKFGVRPLRFPRPTGEPGAGIPRGFTWVRVWPGINDTIAVGSTATLKTPLVDDLSRPLPPVRRACTCWRLIRSCHRASLLAFCAKDSGVVFCRPVRAPTDQHRKPRNGERLAKIVYRTNTGCPPRLLPRSNPGLGFSTPLTSVKRLDVVPKGRSRIVRYQRSWQPQRRPVAQ